LDHAPDRIGRTRHAATTRSASPARVTRAGTTPRPASSSLTTIRNAARNVATLALAGWLASGSCTVAACYEECDPCFQACKCSSICQNPVAGEQGLRILAHESRVLAADDDRFVRSLAIAVGPSLEFAPDADREQLVEFALRVLDVNAELFTARRDTVWTLVDAQSFPERSVLHFALEPERVAPRRANSVSLLFDTRGRLLEATHVVDRDSD